MFVCVVESRRWRNNDDNDNHDNNDDYDDDNDDDNDNRDVGVNGRSAFAPGCSGRT